MMSTAPTREELSTKAHELHQQREVDWELEQQDRERRVRQHRQKAHQELKQRCLDFFENQQELEALTEQVLKPAMQARLKGLEKRHNRREDAWFKNQQNLLRRKQLPPLLPPQAAMAGGSTMQMPGGRVEASSVFNRNFAARKCEEVVGSPGAPRRNKQLMGTFAMLLEADADAKAGEETAKAAVSRPRAASAPGAEKAKDWGEEDTREDAENVPPKASLLHQYTRKKAKSSGGSRATGGEFSFVEKASIPVRSVAEGATIAEILL